MQELKRCPFCGCRVIGREPGRDRELPAIDGSHDKTCFFTWLTVYVDDTDMVDSNDETRFKAFYDSWNTRAESENEDSSGSE